MQGFERIDWYLLQGALNGQHLPFLNDPNTENISNRNMTGVPPLAPILTRVTGNQAQKLRLKQNRITVSSREMVRGLGGLCFPKTPTPFHPCSVGSRGLRSVPFWPRGYRRGHAEVTEPLHLTRNSLWCKKKNARKYFPSGKLDGKKCRLLWCEIIIGHETVGASKT